MSIKENKNRANLLKVKSAYTLIQIFDQIPLYDTLQIIRFNKKLQNLINKNLNDYKNFFQIEIEIIPEDNKNGKFINISNLKKSNYHIYFYFDNDIKKTKKCQINQSKKKVNKINVKLDEKVNKSLSGLFMNIDCIKEIHFKKFYRKDINNMSSMFKECKSLKQIEFKNCNIRNVTNMSRMFEGCESLEVIKNISSFNTDKVEDMSHMFEGCKILKELNLSNFNTINVINMEYMFSCCSALIELNIGNFDTMNVNNMKYMFNKCSSLHELNIFNFSTHSLKNIKNIFFGCSSLNILVCSNKLIRSHLHK